MGGGEGGQGKCDAPILTGKEGPPQSPAVILGVGRGARSALITPLLVV